MNIGTYVKNLIVVCKRTDTEETRTTASYDRRRYDVCMIIERVVIRRTALDPCDDAFRERGAVDDEQCTSKQLQHLQSLGCTS
jgi:hypothetical protein